MLWAQTGFFSLIFASGSTTSSQLGVLFSAFFDQLARFSIGQYLLWAINRAGSTEGLGQFMPQIVLLIRFIFGMVFVGFTRPDMDPVCSPMSSVLPVSAVLLA